MERLNFQEQFEAIQSIETLSPEIALGTKIVEVLTEAGEEAYFAGGFGRDLFMGKTPKDVDVATSAEFDQVLEILRGANLENVKIQGVQTAGAYPVVLAYSGDFTIEIASYRKDIYEKEVGEKADRKRRKAKTKTGVSLLEDVKRRDLTINTLMFDPLTAQIIDPLTASEGAEPQSGIADLENKLIRFVGDPKERILEDRIRILRAIRFKNRYEGFSYAPETEQAIGDLREETTKISGERIREEMIKIMKLPSRAESLKDLDKYRILETIFPDLAACKGIEQPKELHAEGDVWQHILLVMENFPENPSENLLWAALLHDLGKVTTQKFDEEKGRIVFHGHESAGLGIARKMLNQMEFSNTQTNEILWLIEHHMGIRGITKMRPSKQKALALPHRFDAKLKSEKLAQDLLSLLWADNQASLREDGSVDQENFDQAKEVVETIITEYADTPLNIKEGLGIDGPTLINLLEIQKSQQMYIGRLVSYLNEHYQDDPSLNREQILEMAQNYWRQENVLSSKM